MSSTLEASVFMEKNYSEILHSIKNTEKNLTLKQMFDTAEKLIVGQSGEIFGVTPINWEDSSRKQLSLINDEEVISLSNAKVYVFSDSVSRKDESERNIKFCLGRKIELVQEFITIQNFGRNRRRTNGIRVKYFPRIHHIAALQQSPWFHVQNERSRTISKDEWSSCRCSMTSHGDLKRMNGNAMLTPTLCLYLHKKFPAGTVVISRTWIRKEVVF